MLRKLARILKHLCFFPWRLRRMLPAHTQSAITRAIRDSERGHSGEIRFAVEATLDWPHLRRQQTPRERALEVFSQLRVWDTELNNGVLIYVLLADRTVEIIADRGINKRVGQESWQRICADMEKHFHGGDFEAGILAGIQTVGHHLAQHFGGPDLEGNELPNRPTIIKS
jgi:uncharacterized membrane protein